MLTDSVEETAAQLVLSVAFADAVTAADGARRFQAELAAMPSVREVQIKLDRPRIITGAELVLAIGTAVVVARSTRELLREINRLVDELTKLGGNLKVLKSAWTVERRPVEQLDEQVLAVHAAKRKSRAARHAA
jgi:hypothetical protein